MAIQNNWNKRELIRQYNSYLYKRIALSKDKKTVKQLGKKGQIIEKLTDAIKDHNVLEFLDLREDEKAVSRYGFLNRDLMIGFDYRLNTILKPVSGQVDFDIVQAALLLSPKH